MHIRNLIPVACVALLGAALAFSNDARAYETTLNIKDADINTLITTVSEVTGRNFIVDQRVKGKVTVISSTPMSADGVYETFLAVLQVYGFAAVPAGEAIKIIPEATVRQEGGAQLISPRGLAQEEVITRVLQIQNVPAAQLVPILRPLVPQWGHLAAYAPSNMLIIADRAVNVIRLERIIAEIDQSGDRDIQMVKLAHASAAEVVRILTTLTQQDKQQDPTARPAALIADERTNSVLIGGDRADRQKLLAIIKTLDVPTGEDGATQVVYLRYASAEALAPILEGYAQQADQTSNAQAGQAAQTRGNTQSRILADPDTNALVITAAPKTMRQVRGVIEQLDIRRYQVLVETLIAEVSASKQSQLGIDWAVFNPERIAATGILDPTTLTALAGAIGGATSGNPAGAATAVGQVSNLTGLTAFGGSIRDSGTSFGVLIRALQGDGDTNILSAPTLMTMDNEEAEFSVGQEVPFLTGQFTNTGATNSSVNPFQTIQRQDVGLTLGITPQINEGNSVKLKLNLEISSLSSGSTSALDLITNKRTITNTVSVDSGQILVIGGLIDDQVTDNQSGIPFLSKIPLLGGLFRSRNVRNEKRNLMVFIRPAILKQASDGDYYTRRKYDYIRGIQTSTHPDGIPMVGGRPPTLPDFEQYQQDRPPESADDQNSQPAASGGS